MLSTSSMLLAGLNMLKYLLTLPATFFGVIKWWQHYRKCMNSFPGSPTLPLFGNLLDSGFPIEGSRVVLHTLTETFSRYVAGRWSLGPFEVIFLNDPRDIQAYLKNQKNQNKPSIVYNIVAAALGRGLATENDEVWRRHHKIIQPTFHSDILGSQLSAFSRRSDEYVAVLEKHADGRPFDMQILTEQLTMDIVQETLFGNITHFIEENEINLFRLISRSQCILNYRLFHPWFYPNILFQLFSEGRELTKIKKMGYDILEKALREREKELDERKVEALDFEGYYEGSKRLNTLDAMALGMRKGVLTHEELLEESLTFTLGGFDTTCLTVLSLLYFVAKNPKVQEKLSSEIRTVFKEDGQTEFTMETIKCMKYMDMVVNETLRIHPPVWFIARCTGIDTPLVSSDLVIPEGAMVVIAPKVFHMNPETYPNPDVFDPERFSPENTAMRHPCAFLPFSKGPRACIGRRYAMLEVKTIIAKVLNKFELKPDPTYTPGFNWGVTATPKYGMRIKLYKR